MGRIDRIFRGWLRAEWFAGLAREDPAEVPAAVDPERMPGKWLSIVARALREGPPAIRDHDVSVMFFTCGLSELGSAPARCRKTADVLFSLDAETKPFRTVCGGIHNFDAQASASRGRTASVA